MLTDRLITVAIHTYDRAQQLKTILEAEGIGVTLQNVDLTNPAVFAGVRVRIREVDLPLALRLIENIEIFTPEAIRQLNDSKACVLVPVDFSDCSFRAASVAFNIADLHKVPVMLIHSYIDPAFAHPAAELSDELTFEPAATEDPVEEYEEEKAVSHIALESMSKFVDRLKEKIKDGVLPAVKFTTSVTEGLPEEVIDEYVTSHKVMLIVMGTRGADSRNREILGSVTAEVLDACKAPVLTVTPDVNPSLHLTRLRNVVFFAAAKQDDILALDALYRLFPDLPLHVTLLLLPRGKFSDPHPDALSRLTEYCRLNYPAYTFSSSPLSSPDPIDDYNAITAAHPADLIVTATRRKNIFARLFNPSWAHKLLFHAETPLMSIPLNS